MTSDWHTHAVKIEGLDARVVRNHYSNEDIQRKAEAIAEIGRELSPFVARVIGMPRPENSR